MSCPGRFGATTCPAPVRVRSTAPSPEPKIRCMSPRLVDEDVVMYECEKEDPASVRLGAPHAILEHAESNALRPACPPATAPAEIDTHDDDDGDDDDEEELEEWEEEEDGEIDHGLPSSAGATTGSLSNNRAKLVPSPPPRAGAPTPPLRFERFECPIEVHAPPPALAPSGPTGVKIDDESGDGLWREPTCIPASFLHHPDRPGSESAGGHPESTSERIGTCKESSEPHRAGEHDSEISINLATGAETASLDLHLTSGSVAASRDHSAAPSSKPTFDLKVTAKGPGRFSISAAWERGGAR